MAMLKAGPDPLGGLAAFLAPFASLVRPENRDMQWSATRSRRVGTAQDLLGHWASGSRDQRPATAGPPLSTYCGSHGARTRASSAGMCAVSSIARLSRSNSPGP